MQMQNPYGFDGSLKIKNMPFSTFLKLTQIWVYHLHSFPPQLLHPFGGTTACCEIKKGRGIPKGGTPACCENINPRLHNGPCQFSALTQNLSKKDSFGKFDTGTLAC